MNQPFDLENHLRAALERQQPSGGFTERVLARTAHSARPAWHSYAAASLAASLLVGAIFVREAGERRERQQGEAARAQVLQALSITSHTLRRIQKKLDGLNHE